MDVDQIEAEIRLRGARRLDMEGIVAKQKNAAYRANVQKSHWIKIKNPGYSPKEGRKELFDC